MLEKIAEENDTTTVQVKVLDQNGVQCLDAAQLVRFSSIGDGHLIDNQGTSTGARKVQLYNGRAIIKIKNNNAKNIVSVQSEGLPTAFLELK